LISEIIRSDCQSYLSNCIDEIRKLAEKREVKVKNFSRAAVKDGFAESGATTKQEIAIGIAAAFPRTCSASPALQEAVDERGL
jgi:hypothetical protein